MSFIQFSCSSGNTNSTEKLSLFFSKGLIKVLMVLAKFLKSFLSHVFLLRLDRMTRVPCCLFIKVVLGQSETETFYTLCFLLSLSNL